MTPPREPLECGYFVQCVKEAGHKGTHRVGRAIPKWTVPTIEPIEAEAAGAPLREALADVLRKWDRWYITTPEGERPNNVEFLAVKKAVIEASEALGRTATPAPARCSGCGERIIGTTHWHTPAPAPCPHHDINTRGCRLCYDYHHAPAPLDVEMDLLEIRQAVRDLIVTLDTTLPRHALQVGIDTIDYRLAHLGRRRARAAAAEDSDA